MDTKIYLNKFQPRDYQLAACDAFENKRFRKMILIFPRRSGKDMMVFNLVVRRAIRETGLYTYCLPTFKQARQVIWDMITNDGTRLLDYIPKELVAGMNSSELKITLINGSIIQLIGSDSYNTSLVGTNPRMVVFSEFGLCDPDAFKFILPILNANGGAFVIVSTPRGKNTLWDLYNIALANPDSWYCEKLSVEDTQHIPLSLIEDDVREGVISQDLVQQEYYCSFECGDAGSFYAKYIKNMRLNGQICDTPWDPSHLVHTSWDLGTRDSTCIIFYQFINNTVRVIDCYRQTKEGLEHYVTVLKSKPYNYGKHFAPHDIAVRELGSGLTRIEKAASLGLNFEKRVDPTNGSASSSLPQISVVDGIEAVRTNLCKTWIDQTKCAELIKALENYRAEWDNVRKVYRAKPLHDKYSDFADAFRYLAVSIPGLSCRDSSKEELESRYRSAQGYGTINNGFMEPGFAQNGFNNGMRNIY